MEHSESLSEQEESYDEHSVSSSEDESSHLLRREGLRFKAVVTFLTSTVRLPFNAVRDTRPLTHWAFFRELTVHNTARVWVRLRGVVVRLLTELFVRLLTDLFTLQRDRLGDAERRRGAELRLRGERARGERLVDRGIVGTSKQIFKNEKDKKDKKNCSRGITRGITRILRPSSAHPCTLKVRAVSSRQ